MVVWARSEASAEKAAEKAPDARVVTDLDHLKDSAIVPVPAMPSRSLRLG